MSMIIYYELIRVNPASTLISCPIIESFSSTMWTAWAISVQSTGRPCLLGANLASTSSLGKASYAFDQQRPGATTFTIIFGARTFAIVRPKLWVAALPAEYAVIRGFPAPSSPSTDPIKIIFPPSLFLFIAFMACFVVVTATTKFSFRLCCQLSRFKSFKSSWPMALPAPLAFATTISNRPKSLMMFSKSFSVCLSSERSAT